jgi:hypothetical protein
MGTGWTGLIADLIRRRHGDVRSAGEILRPIGPDPGHDRRVSRRPRSSGAGGSRRRPDADSDDHTSIRRMVPMASDATDRSRPQFSTAALVTSAVLVGAGTFVVLAGLAVGGSHLIVATRQWVREMEVPPSELAKIKLTQAKAAVAAGSTAWQNGTQAQPADVS